MSRLPRFRARALPVLAFAVSAAVFTATHALAGGAPPAPGAPPAKQAPVKFAAVTTDPATKSAYEEALAAAHRLAQSPELLAQVVELEAAAAAPVNSRRRPIEIRITSWDLRVKPAAVQVSVTDAEGASLGSSPAVDFGDQPTVSLKIRWPKITITIIIKVERAQ